MFVRDYEKVYGSTALQDLRPGRFVMVTTSGVRYPAVSGEQPLAVYVVDHIKTNLETPLYGYQNSQWPIHAAGFSDRRGFSDPNLPASGVTVYMTQPQFYRSATIPSGQDCLRYDKGVFTVISGDYTDGLIVGSGFEVDPVTGKAKLLVSGARVGFCLEVATNGDATLATRGL